MEKTIPSAPPEELNVTYPALNGLIEKKTEADVILAYSEKVQGPLIENKQSQDCVKCYAIIEIGKVPVISLPCDHKIHFHCAKDWTKGGTPVCKKCDGSKKEEDTGEDEEDIADEEVGIPVAYGTDPIITAEFDRKLGLDKIKKEIKAITDKGLSKADISKILGGYVSMKSKFPDTITFEMLYENNITISDLINRGFSAPTVFEHMGVNDVEQLLKLGMTKENFKTRNFKLSFMNMLYKLDYVGLKEHFKLNLMEAIKMCSGKPNVLVLIGLNMHGLMMHGLTLDKMLTVSNCFSKEDWISKIGLKKKHLYEFGCEKLNFEWFGWNTFESVRALKLNVKDMEHFGISFGSVVTKKTKNTETRHSRQKPISIIGLLSKP
jgi:hypothetical protein